MLAVVTLITVLGVSLFQLYQRDKAIHDQREADHKAFVREIEHDLQHLENQVGPPDKQGR